MQDLSSGLEDDGVGIEQIYGKDYVDVTEDVQCYEKGKTFGCECGQGFGVEFDLHAIRCPTCGRNCVDRDWEEREPPERESGQSSLSNWA